MAFAASSAFINTLRFGSFVVATKATVYQNGTSTNIELPISVANITVDRNAAYRRQGTITAELVPTVPPPELMPTGPNSLLAPFGTEIKLESGLVLPETTSTGVPTGGTNTSTEYVPLGMFEVATTIVDDTTVDLIVTLDVYDRSWAIDQRAFKAPYNVPAAGGNFVAEVTALLNSVWDQTNNAMPLQFNITPTAAVVPPASFNQGSGPWQAVLAMAQAVGYEIFFDVNGVVRGYPIPDPAQQPVVWNFTDQPSAIFGTPGTGSNALFGDEYTTPIATQVTMTRDQIYNDVIVQATGSQNAPGAASGSTAPTIGEALDNNPASSTYVAGGMGDVPQIVSTNLAISQAQAQAMAANVLAQDLSAAWQVEITATPNPVFDVDDVVTITRPRVGLNGARMVLDTITHVVSYQDSLQVTGRIIPEPVGGWPSP